MPRVRGQVVIGVAVLILSAAFLLVGVYFAQLQGLLFQNGANSLQLFANNLAAAKNALYTAPSSMTITLAGNNSLCTWSSAIDAYDCAGGSKVYNVSYASGPTLDAGTNTFSVALCVMVTVSPLKLAGKLLGKASSAGILSSDVGSAVGEATIETLKNEEQQFLGVAEKASEHLGEISRTSDSLQKLEGIQNLKSIGNDAADEAGTLSANAVESAQQVQNSFLGSLSKGIQKTSLFFSKHPHVRALLSNIGLYVSSFWLGQTVGSFDSNITNGLVLKDPVIPAFSSNGQLAAGQLLSTYVTGEPILTPGGSAMSLQLMQYSQLLVSTEDLQGAAATVQTYNDIENAVGEAVLQQNIFNEINAYSSSSASNPYATPISGVQVPTVLSSPNEFVNSAIFDAPTDPIVSTGSFLAQKAFVVYGQTASCLGVMPNSLNVNTALTDSATVLGSVLTPLNAYTKVDLITQLGTYFLGYGGEIYIDGQSSGRATAVGAPVITDQSDLCGIATTSSQPGTNLQTMILPVNGGDITLSINQGLFNTMCSPNDVLFPQPVSDFINKMITSVSGKKNVSILLPPQYAIGITNSSTSSSICLYSVAMDQSGTPVSVGSGSSLLEYGMPLSCFNVSSMTGGKENLVFTTGAGSGFDLSGIGTSAFFLNNDSVVGFSIPPGTYVDGNFVSGPPTQLKVTKGVDSPMVNLLSPLLQNYTKNPIVKSIVDGVQTSAGSSLLNAIIDGLFNTKSDNYSYYPTEYTNLTFSVQNVSGNLELGFVSNNLIFGVYPYNYNSYGGSYGSGG